MEDVKIWYCKIGFAEGFELPPGADQEMRSLVAAAFQVVVGRQPDATFSCWAGPGDRQFLSDGELDVAERILDARRRSGR